MIKNLITIFLLVALSTSCGTSEKKGAVKEDEFTDLTNEKFNMPPAINYNAVDDFIEKGVTSEDNVLMEESIGKVPPEDIEEPGDVSSGLNKILLSCYRRNFKNAEAYMDKYYKPYRKNPIYWTQVGSCYLIQGQKRKALLYFNKAKDLKKDYAPPVNNIGVIFQQEGFDQKAVKAYEEAKKLSSFSLTPIYNLAQIYAKYGFISQGKDLFESLVRLNGKDNDALYGLGYFELLVGNYGKSVSYFSQLDNDYRRKPEVGINVAYSLGLNGNKSKGIDVLNDISGNLTRELSTYKDEIQRFLQ